jgi:hypothetical protein
MSTKKKKNPPSNATPAELPETPELPPDWHEKLQVGMGQVLNEEQFQALMKERGQKPQVLELPTSK